MPYSIAQILKKCPEKINNKIYYAWNLEEYYQFFSIAVSFLSLVPASELRNAVDDWDVQKMLCESIYKVCPRDVHNFLEQTGIEIDKKIFNKEYAIFFAQILKQNFLFKSALEIIENPTKKEEHENTPLDFYDAVADIVHYRLWSGLSLDNFEQKLTPAILDFLCKKVANLKKKQMLQFYRPLHHAIALALSDQKTAKQIPNFFDSLFAEPVSENNELERNKEFYIPEEYRNNKEWIIEFCKKNQIFLTMFLPMHDIPEDLIGSKLCPQ